MTTATIKTRISIKDTLLALPIEEPVIIENKVIPFLKIKRGVDYLNSKGYRFSLTTAGRIDDVIVTRLK